MLKAIPNQWEPVSPRFLFTAAGLALRPSLGEGGHLSHLPSPRHRNLTHC